MNNFTIDQHNEHWLVEWPNLGPVESDHTKWRLLDVAFDQLGCWEVGIGCNIQRPADKQWFIQWISVDAWSIVGDNEKLKYHLFRAHHGKEVSGILFNTLDQAEAFIEKIQARLTFYRLKQNYSL